MYPIFQIFYVVHSRISDIFGIIHVSQVAQSVICSYPIYMVNLLLTFNRFKKGLCNKPMNFSILPFYSYNTVAIRML